MRCPFCGAHDTKVVDSRLSGEGDQVRRRRECVECAERFTTYETIELAMPRIVKSDGSRETFQVEKILAGINRALEKRPVGAEGDARRRRALEQTGGRVACNYGSGGTGG